MTAGIPAERYNAIAAAVQVGRDHVPFSIRRKAVEAAEAVVVDWEENYQKWCAFHDEIDRLNAEILALKVVADSGDPSPTDSSVHGGLSATPTGLRIAGVPPWQGGRLLKSAT